MNLNQFENQFQTYNQIRPILIENGVPFTKSGRKEKWVIIWLKDVTLYLYSNDTFDSYSHNIKKEIQYANKKINNHKVMIQEDKQRYMVSKDIKYIKYIEDNKMYVIETIHFIETAKYYESRTV